MASYQHVTSLGLCGILFWSSAQILCGMLQVCGLQHVTSLGLCGILSWSRALILCGMLQVCGLYSDYLVPMSEVTGCA